MSAYHPVYHLEPALKSDAKSVSDKNKNKQNSRHTGRPVLPSKRHKTKQNHVSRNGKTLRSNSCYHIEDERRSSSEERYSRRKGEKYRRKEDHYERKSRYHEEEDSEDDLELYCQKPSSSPTSWEDTSFSYIAGIMYPSPPDGEVSRYLPSSSSGSSLPGWPVRVPICRPRFWKFLLLVVVLLMMAQFSLNILFYRNYDSLFYVNVTSAESLASFESRVRWVSSKLPWVHSTTEKPITVIPLHKSTYDSSSVPLMIGGKEVKDSSIGTEEEVPLLRQMIEAENRRQKMKLKNSAVPSDKIPDEGGGNASAKLIISRSNTNETSASPSKIPNNSNKMSGASPEISKISSNLETSPNNSSSGDARETKRVLLSKEKSLCPPVPPKLGTHILKNAQTVGIKKMVGFVKIFRSVPNLEEQERSRPELEPGGRFRPAECRARHRVAIIVPYRDRIKHLAMFIYHIHPILQRQQIDYAIYIVEQEGSGKFNRAMLLNVGALEALKQYQYDCFIFHDVDLLPEDDRNLYTCPEQPRHMSIAIDSMGYKLPYNDIFGGVSAMTVDQFRTVNGFSNKFWGWGGEDDDMSNRIKFHGFFISRYPANIGRYTMLSHRKDEPNPKRYQYLYDGKKRFKSDGLNSAKYKTLDVQLRRLYTWVFVDLYPS